MSIGFYICFFFSQIFSFNEIMHFQKFILVFLHITFHLQSGSSITTLVFYTEKEWPNLGEEEEWEENNIREFTKLIEQHEQAWKPAKEEFETIDVGNEKIKRELKIRTLITLKEREELIALLQDYVDFFFLVLQGYAWFV